MSKRLFLILLYGSFFYSAFAFFSYSIALKNFSQIPEKKIPEGGGEGTAKIVSIRRSGFLRKQYFIRVRNYESEMLIPAEAIYPENGSEKPAPDLSVLQEGGTIGIHTWGNLGFGPPLIMGLDLIQGNGQKIGLLQYDVSVKRYLEAKTKASEVADEKKSQAVLLFIGAFIAHGLVAWFYRKRSRT